MFNKPVGTKDILPEEAYRWQYIEQISRNIFSVYNYQEIRTPLIEEAKLFNRTLGVATEIVQKQMFLFKKENDIYALRPEATASIARAYIENNLDKTAGFTKLYYIGAMFRLERPQKGRQRQFHHLGCEAIGSTDPVIDVELISLAARLLEGLSISGYKININSLGCAKDKEELTVILHNGLKDKVNKLCKDCKTRFKRNTLRILDCKNQACQDVIKSLDIRNNHLCPECKGHFLRVLSGLDALKVKYEVLPYLVRGLDYYTRTVFEITHPELGAQDALGAGGRYDNLISDLGGPEAGAIGFAFGMERLLLVSSIEYRALSESLVYLITLGEEARVEGLKILHKLRKNGITCDTDYENKSLKGAMRKANDLGVKYVLLLGEDELKKKIVTLKDMASGEQREVKQEDIIGEIKC